MVLPPSAADDAPDPDPPGWLRRLKGTLRLSRGGLLVWVDHARPERLGELVRALLPRYPGLEVYAEAQRLVEAEPGSTLVLVPREEDADWLNINRSLFASRALRVVLFCTREVSVALARGAVDFFDWISHRVECPAGPAPYAVAGLRGALAARVPGIVWTGGDLEASFAMARPRRRLRRVSAAKPYEELVEEARKGQQDWLAWTDVDGDFRLRRVRWALAEVRRRTRAILVEPSVRSPGWWEVHGRVADFRQARERLEQAGAHHPGRLAALVDLEPEAIDLLITLLEQGESEGVLEGEVRASADPGAALGRWATLHGLIPERDIVRGACSPPVMRASGGEMSRMRLLREAELDAILQRLRAGELDEGDAAWWSAWTRPPPPSELLPNLRGRGVLAEALLRQTARTGLGWRRVTSMALSAGDGDVAHAWALCAIEAEPERRMLLEGVIAKQLQWSESEPLPSHFTVPEKQRSSGWFRELLWSVVCFQMGLYSAAEQSLRRVLAMPKPAPDAQSYGYCSSLVALAVVLAVQGKYAEAEELLRQLLVVVRQTLGEQHPTHGSALRKLADVLTRQGRYVEAEELRRQTLAIVRQAFGEQHREYGSALKELADVLTRQGRYAEAEQLLRQSLVIREQTLGARHPSSFLTLVLLATNLIMQGRSQEGEPLLLRSAELAREPHDLNHPEVAQALTWLAHSQAALKKPEAAATAQQALDALLSSLGPEHPDTKAALSVLNPILKKDE